MPNGNPFLRLPDPEFDVVIGPGEPVPAPEPTGPPMTDEEIVQVLLSYNSECEQARQSGHSPRDAIWEANWALYWNKYDWSNKADWQAKEIMPEAPQFVDRWSSAIREALTTAGEWYTVTNPAMTFGGLAKEIRMILDESLEKCGTNQQGHDVNFLHVFEEVLKLGAITALCLAVTWRRVEESVMVPAQEFDADGNPFFTMRQETRTRGKVAVEVVDPRTVWFDPKRRGLYRRRRIHMDLHQLRQMAKMVDSEGTPIYRQDVVDRIVEDYEDDFRRTEEEAASGSGAMKTATGRKGVVLDEYLCAIVKADGTLAWPSNTWVVMANEKYIIVGPEPNPFWHGRDWIVFLPLITVPLATYGKSYMEDFASLARTFTEMTNLIIDGIFTTAMHAFAGDPSKLLDPTELEEGIHPNKLFQLEEGTDPREFLHAIELGRLPPEVIAVWQGIKAEFREAGKQNELSLGQVPPKGDITATEIQEAQAGSAAVTRSIAKTIEHGALDLTLDLVWQTRLQYLDLEPDMVKRMGTMGELLQQMPPALRYGLVGNNYRFRAHGISSILDRARDRNALLAALNWVASNETLLAEFLARYSPRKVLDRTLRLFGVNTDGLERGPDEPAPQQAQSSTGRGQLAPGTPPAIQGAQLGGAQS